MSENTKKLVITEDGVSWEGFADLYQVLGFIDVHCDPAKIRNSIIANVETRSMDKKEPKE